MAISRAAAATLLLVLAGVLAQVAITQCSTRESWGLTMSFTGERGEAEPFLATLAQDVASAAGAAGAVGINRIQASDFAKRTTPGEAHRCAAPPA